MGSKQSSLAKSASTDNHEEIQELEVKLSSERGRSVNQTKNIIEVSLADLVSDSESDSDDDSDDDDEEDEDFAERLRILDDAKKLKELAVAFLHPEKPVVADATACARCYFDRPSAPQQESMEEAEYRRQVLEDAAALKKLAIDYAHPELGVVTTDPTATARCYFDRPSAPQQEELSDEEEVKHLIREIKSLVSSYFDRVSDEEYIEELEYERQVLEDAAALKKLAIDYAHPELGVVTSDPTATARCYFDRPSAPQQESMEEAEYRRQVLEDAAALKKLAIDYAHPELGVVTTDPTATARCYFDRPSAPHQKSEEGENRRQGQVLEDAAALKEVAIVVKNQAVSPVVKTLDSSKDADIARSASSVQLFGLDSGMDESYY